MQKKVKVITICTIIGICLIVLAIILKGFIFDNENNKIDSYSLQIDKTNERVNVDVLVYGEDPGFREEFEWRRIEAITKKTLEKDVLHSYRWLIIVDYDGGVEMTDEELLLIKDKVENEYLNFLYIGEKYLDDFERLGFTEGFDEGELSFAYIGASSPSDIAQQNNYAVHGMWTEYDEKLRKYYKELLQEVIVNFIYEYSYR